MNTKVSVRAVVSGAVNKLGYQQEQIHTMVMPSVHAGGFYEENDQCKTRLVGLLDVRKTVQWQKGGLYARVL